MSAPACAQPGDAGGVFVRAIAVGRTGRRRRRAFHIDIVFDGDRNAVERQRYLAGLPQSARFGEKLRLVPERDENRRIVVRADARIGSRDDVLGLGSSTSISFEDFGDRLRHRRLRISREKRARNRVRRPSLCQIRGISQWARPPAARGRPWNKLSGCVGSAPSLYSFSFSVITDDVSGFARTGGRSAEEICIWLSPP